MNVYVHMDMYEMSYTKAPRHIVSNSVARNIYHHSNGVTSDHPTYMLTWPWKQGLSFTCILEEVSFQEKIGG